VGFTVADEEVNQNEVLKISSVGSGGTVLTLQQAVQFNHYGGEYKAEVALLTRRILFKSDVTSTRTLVGMKQSDAPVVSMLL
jgi:hypothetical protein